jgi:deoxyadenosine/deoxycytidine kinase
MGDLIVVVGNTGVGKTTLVRALCTQGKFIQGLEGHADRPFQALFKADPRYALANQIDYLLVRAEQEHFIRREPQTGVQDGGLDMDFFVFTHLFRQKGFLSADEFSLCERLYRQVRYVQPSPELFIRMDASPEILTDRFARRGRPLEITAREDLIAITGLLDDWLSHLDPERVLLLDASTEDPDYRYALPGLLQAISRKLQVKE